TLDLSEELKVYKVVLFDCVAKDLEIQIAMIFDQQSILEYLSLYEMFINTSYYLRFYEKQIVFLNEVCLKTIGVAVRNADISCFLPLLTYEQFLQNIPSMLESIPFQRILNERKNK
ncbi:motility associated factor glycosyltransferase family protein, partial [Campylobacter jejuni]|nr:motility associated factor glycosyltransferase family protein [Campylobacter jejuni]